ncbi:FHA domain-containing protein [Vibrio navarrensis]|uniref:type VI secretion system-associated FHA domain protein TagH n=1 Tax=Vibrio TaxID=662 RepID=UPI00186A58AB|nr:MULTISPECIES: type VI secretion system-associated FHA domain protein TagH [Vibrio]MBE4581638.1 FHA domain-containing protein [Vibrio navarrensis]MBE4586744.1 FHA domain-containing protein [Vibrio navarrensis]MBE4609167.1 FHA domain-containing protein [Vibrio navarrensis]MBE4612895.1 FHA domain-containing protein [Vibrio navarrensis]MBG0756934.1 FHA domain-containing protein [Vibrio cidicii]
MGLVLSITSFHKFTPELQSVFTLSSAEEHCSIKFGRADSCDWVLPDPERIISGVHGEISKFGKDYLLRDLSTNGIFINKSVSPVGNGIEIALKDKDTINFGDYEIEVSLQENQQETPIDKEPVFSSSNTLSPRDILSTPIDTGSPDYMDFGFDANLFLAQEESTSSLPHPDIGSIDDFFDSKSDVKNEAPTVSQSNADRALPLSRKFEGEAEPRIDSLLKAFLNGAGIDQNLIPDGNKEAWFNELGRSYSLMLEGLMQTLHNRAEFKQANKLNHTAFQRSENNPLKFSANLDDAIHNLYNRRSASFLSPEAAIKSAFRDIETHEAAMVNGVHGAVSGVMKLLDPNNISEHISQRESNAVSALFSKTEKKKWHKYESLYYQLNNEMDSDKNHFYLEDFAKAYEIALRNTTGE